MGLVRGLQLAPPSGFTPTPSKLNKGGLWVEDRVVT